VRGHADVGRERRALRIVSVPIFKEIKDRVSRGILKDVGVATRTES
jgi:hypothetical protein